MQTVMASLVHRTVNEHPENSWRLNKFYLLDISFAPAHNNVLQLYQKYSVDFCQT